MTTKPSEAELFIANAKEKSNAYMVANQVKNASSIIQRDLYTYGGQSYKAMVVQYLNPDCNYSQNRFSGYPFAFLEGGYSGGGDISFAAQGVRQSLLSLLRHYDMPYYSNIIGTTFNNLIAGISSGDINCKFLEIQKNDTDMELINIDLQLKQQMIQKKYAPRLREIDENEETELLGQRDKGEKVAQKINAFYNQQRSEVNRNMQLALQHLNEDYDTKFFQPMALISSQANLLVAKIGQEVNWMLHDRDNIAELTNIMRTFMSSGFAVMKIHYDENKNKFEFRNTRKPEACFFSTITNRKNKSDGLFCGEIRYVDRMIVAEQYNLSKEEVELLPAFPPLTAVYSSFFNEGAGLDAKNYISICDYYYIHNKKTYLAVLTKDSILEEKELKHMGGKLPLIYLDSANVGQIQSSSIFHTLFPLQHAMNETHNELYACQLNTSCAKSLVANVPDAVRSEIKTNMTRHASVVFYTVDAGTNSILPPSILPPSELPASLLQFLQQQENSLVMALNNSLQSTHNAPLIASVSGTAMENSTLAKESALMYYLDEMKKELTLAFQRIIIPNMYEVITKKKTAQFTSGVERYMIETLKEHGEDVFKSVTQNIKIEIEWTIDGSIRRSRTNAEIRALISSGMLPQPLIIPLVEELLLNSDLGGGGNVLVNKLRESLKLEAEQPPQENPELLLKKSELELAAQKIQNDYKFNEAKIAIDVNKMKIGEREKLREDKLKAFDYTITHRTNVNNETIKLSQKVADIVSNNNQSKTSSSQEP